MEYPLASGLIDNRKVADSHQEGISRVKQRKGDMEKGQGGKMKGHSGSSNHFKRGGGSMTPRRG